VKTVAASTEADPLRHALVDDLKAGGSVRSPRVEAALRAVPRHLFLPGTSLARAYANGVVETKRDDAAVPISAASQPTMVALMLEQLQVAPGNRVLEIGAGTGYNAALLARLVGPRGTVTTIDIDEDITDHARAGLKDTGYQQVRVVLGDGALGYPSRAPYDRIIATVGTWDLPLAWLDQLTPAGRLVVPLRLRGSVTRSIAFERDATLLNIRRWRSVSTLPCSFMPLRGGIADDPRRDVPLTADGSVSLAVHQDQQADDQALASVLTRPPTSEQTGVTFGSAQQGSAEWLLLWLTCTLNAPLSRMSARPQAIEAGLVSPMSAMGSWATVDGASLAYLTGRPGNGGRHEVGVIGHGPHGADLAREVAAQVRAWDRRYRAATARFIIQPVTAPGPLSSQFAFRTPNCWLSVNWEDEA
jgi:protein-L-isoaspartate(D-aspartate) O-methyltransferase